MQKCPKLLAIQYSRHKAPQETVDILVVTSVDAPSILQGFESGDET